MDAPMPVRANSSKLLAVLAMALLPWPALAADTEPAIATGTYSSLAYNDESGDLNGYEIEVLPAAKGTKLVLQIAEGELVDVVVAEASQADGTITASFELPRRGGCRLSARVVESSLVVSFDFGNGAIDTATLARSVGYWDRNVASP